MGQLDICAIRSRYQVRSFNSLRTDRFDVTVFIYWCFGKFSSWKRRVAKAFIKLGLRPHRSVAIMGHNAPEWHQGADDHHLQANMGNNAIFFKACLQLDYVETRSLGGLRAPTSSWRPFGPLDFVLRAFRALRPCDLCVGNWIAC